MNAPIDAVTQQAMGLRVEVIEPGSPGDPFVDPNLVVSPTSVASPAPAAGGTATVGPEDGSKAPAFTIPGAVMAPSAPAQVQAPAPAVTPPAAPATPTATPLNLEALKEDADFKALVEGLAKEHADTVVGEKLRTQQSSYDRTINELKEANKALLEAQKTAAREAKLNSPDLTDEEKEALKAHYALEDRAALLDEREEAVDEMYQLLTVAKLVESHSQFGVTEAELSQFKTPEEMEAFAAEKELTFYRGGGTPQAPSRAVTAPTTVPAAEPTSEIPAGAQAPTDLGGETPTPAPVELSKEVGMDAMASNLNKIPWSTVRMPA